MSVVRNGISKKKMLKFVKKASELKYQFISVSTLKGGKFNFVASKKMWNKDLQTLVDAAHKGSSIKSNEREESMAKKGKKGKKSKKAKVDFETLRVNDLIKLGYDEASEAQAVKEVTRRLIRVQAAYKNYVPEDKFRNSTGDPNDMDHVGLIKAWNSEKLVDEAEDIIRIWLNQDAKINGIFA